jgi:hypothetical protein
MYRFSRAIYRELADEVIEDPYGGLFVNHERVLKACEAAVERLATDRHYFAHPSRTLFNDIRVYFPMTSQLRVLRVIQRYLGLADEFFAPPAAERLRRVRQPAPMPGEHPQGHALSADAVATQRILPVASAPR